MASIECISAAVQSRDIASPRCRAIIQARAGGLLRFKIVTPGTAFALAIPCRRAEPSLSSQCSAMQSGLSSLPR